VALRSIYLGERKHAVDHGAYLPLRDELDDLTQVGAARPDGHRTHALAATESHHHIAQRAPWRYAL